MLRFTVLDRAREGKYDDAQDAYDVSNDELTTGYRELHPRKWRVFDEPSRCSHGLHAPVEMLPLSSGMCNTTALDWRDEGRNDDEGDEVPERIAICLTKDDARVRWLAVAQATQSTMRRAMLRGQACESCMVDATVGEAGKWLVIL